MYAYAALRVSVQRWQLDLAVLAKSREEETTRPTLKAVSYTHLPAPETTTGRDACIHALGKNAEMHDVWQSGR